MWGFQPIQLQGKKKAVDATNMVVASWPCFYGKGFWGCRGTGQGYPATVSVVILWLITARLIRVGANEQTRKAKIKVHQLHNHSWYLFTCGEQNIRVQASWLRPRQLNSHEVTGKGTGGGKEYEKGKKLFPRACFWYEQAKSGAELPPEPSAPQSLRARSRRLPPGAGQRAAGGGGGEGPAMTHFGRPGARPTAGPGPPRLRPAREGAEGPGKGPGRVMGMLGVGRRRSGGVPPGCPDIKAQRCPRWSLEAINKRVNRGARRGQLTRGAPRVHGEGEKHSNARK